MESPELPESASEAAGSRLRLTLDQQRLLTALEQRDKRFGCRLNDMLLGALYALSDLENPYRFAGAAQGMRELLEKLPLYYDGAPQRAPSTEPRDHLRKVGDELDRAQSKSANYSQETRAWVGEIDGHLLRFLVRVERAVVAHRSAISKPERNREFIRKQDPLGDLPGDKLEEFMDEWREHDKFFQGTAHYGKSPDALEFEQQMTRCIRFLVARVKPETSEILSILDRIIEEAE